MNSQRETTSVNFGLAVCLGLLFSLGTPTVHAASADNVLKHTYQQYAGVDSVFVEATLQASFHADDPHGPVGVAGTTASGAFRYWAQGEQYRIDSQVTDDRFPSMNVEVAYTGRIFQLLRRDRSVLSFALGDRNLVGVSLPNPFMDVASFVNPLDDASPDRMLKLSDFSSRTDIAQQLSTIEWTAEEVDGHAIETAVLPGAVMEGVPYSIHVQAAGSAMKNSLKRLSYVAADTDQALMTLEFSGYAVADEGGGVDDLWPRRIEYSVYNAEGEPMLSLTYLIQRLEINQPYGDEVFWIDLNEAETLWSDDLQLFIPLYRQNRPPSDTN